MTPDAIKANFEARSNAASELKSLYTEAAGRELSAEERSTEDNLSAAISGFDASIASGLEGLKSEAAAAEARSEFEGILPKGNSEEAPESDVAKFARGELRSLDFAPESRAINATTSNSVGGALVPETMYGQIVEQIVENSTVLQANATVLSTAGGDTVTVPVTATYPSAALVTETNLIGASNPTFAQVDLNAYKYAFLTQASNELLQDSAFDVESFLARVGGQALGNGTGAAFINGVNATMPNGLFVGATTGVTTAATLAITFDELIDLEHSVTTPYRQNGVFIMNDSTLKAVRKLKGSDGQYIWQPSTQVGAPDTLLGHAVFTDPAVPAIASLAKTIAFGDVSRCYVVRLAGAIRVERSDEYAFGNDLVTWRFIARVDGEIVDSNAVKLLAQKV